MIGHTRGDFHADLIVKEVLNAQGDGTFLGMIVKLDGCLRRTVGAHQLRLVMDARQMRDIRNRQDRKELILCV